jgi:AhpD family alkylhydroperoxidase
MATIRLISEAEATGKVKEIFDDFKKTRNVDFVPNYWRALAAFPEYLEATWNKYKTVMLGGKLDRLTKEIIALAVSATNGCEYCINSHTAAVKRLGLDDAAVVEIMAVVDFFNASNSVADGLQIAPDILPEVQD